ncbi:hypothetical protein N5094_17470 [Shewanella putrefaciens]|uniref:hypothetical protein n=1 Tax=Shewanella putrefaciens TaxID=24 RepID=UPI0021BE6108|nr:hypothetical protein [Shewanella putrefaciens]UXK08159.1 hypothetical protein N5094_17470 [Shewanella putrefaciens]
MSEVNLGMETMKDRRIPANSINTPHGRSAVSWAAIFAGAAGAAALSLLLMLLGTGLGFSAISPWSMEGISAATFGVAAIAWLSFTQLAASGMGGYLAGRLRTKWTDVHTDEVYFRDTAHGFLTWAVASLLTVVVLTSVVGSIGSGVRASADVVGKAASAAGTAVGSAATLATSEAGNGNHSIGYFVDSLFRDDSNGPRKRTTPQVNKLAQEIPAERMTPQVNEQMPEVQTEATTPQVNALANEQAPEILPIPVREVSRILAQALQTGTLSPEDERYIGQLITQRTDLTQQEAEQRVSQGFEKVQTTLKNAETTARQAADEARKASAYAALWMAVALLLGAFVASVMAIFGGRQRDA